MNSCKGLKTPLETIENLKTLSQRYNLKLLVLFGSRSKGTFKQKSDWDFAFLASKTNIDETKLHEDLMSLLKNEKIDLINIQKPKNFIIAKNIFLTGIPIYEKRKGIYTQLKWGAWIEAQDFKRYYDRKFEITKKKLRICI